MKFYYVYNYPDIEFDLIGHEEVRLSCGDKYVDSGVSAFYQKKNMISYVKLSGRVDLQKAGIYYLKYTLKYHKIIMNVKRRILVDCPPIPIGYDQYDNTTHGWGLKYNGHKRSVAYYSSIAFLKTYNAYYIGNDEKVIYLSFDDGGIAGSFINEIVDVLNKNNVKATFFFTRNYFFNHKTLINRLINTGHLIGNHTYQHLSMPILATSEMINNFYYEIKSTEEAYKIVTGKEMPKIFRYPKGQWSLRTLQILKDLGYKTYFWSVAYDDWDKVSTKEEALKKYMSLYHNGAIYLIHTNNIGNYEALEPFIINMKILGYHFDLLNSIN